MKNVVMCQLSVMLESGLPGSIDYEKYARDFYKNINRNAFSLNSPVPDRNTWNQIPPDIPRIMCTSSDVDFNFSANNALFVLKEINEDWNCELTKLASEASKLFENIGLSYKFNYRLGIVLTVQSDHVTLCKNASSYVDNAVTDKTEWQLSFLDHKNNNALSINVWKRFIQNKNEDYSNYIIDVNTSLDSQINLRDNSIIKVFETLNEKLGVAYDEFTE